MPYPAGIGSEPVCVGSTCGKVAVVEHVALNRSSNSMDALSDVSYSTMQMRTRCMKMGTVSMSCNANCRWWTVVAVTVGLSLKATTGKHRTQRDACKSQFPNHEGSTPVKNSVRKKLLLPGLSKASSMKLD
jgi:hypothetical protein